MKRGVTKEEFKLINVWVPEKLVPIIDRAVKTEDTDRSKFIRQAIREKMTRSGILIPGFTDAQATQQSTQQSK